MLKLTFENWWLMLKCKVCGLFWCGCLQLLLEDEFEVLSVTIKSKFDVWSWSWNFSSSVKVHLYVGNWVFKSKLMFDIWNLCFKVTFEVWSFKTLLDVDHSCQELLDLFGYKVWYYGLTMKTDHFHVKSFGWRNSMSSWKFWKIFSTLLTLHFV